MKSQSDDYFKQEIQTMKTIPVFFTSKMVADAHSFSPSPRKPVLAVESWKELKVPITIIEPMPVTAADINLAHDSDYVSGVLNGKTNNGFGNTLHAVATTLPYTSGAMVAAAREAIANGSVAVAPVAGFHHATYEHGGGYCTFNGLMVTAMMLKQEGIVEKVGILDFDQHYGNGTDNIIQQLNLDWVEHYSAGNKYYSESQAAEFLARIPELMEQFTECDILLYQAGADPHIDDPLGGWLTTEQMAQRDRIVFETAKQIKLPIAWNLAGGYQKDIRKVLDIHDNTIRQCWAVFGHA